MDCKNEERDEKRTITKTVWCTLWLKYSVSHFKSSIYGGRYLIWYYLIPNKDTQTKSHVSPAFICFNKRVYPTLYPYHLGIYFVCKRPWDDHDMRRCRRRRQTTKIRFLKHSNTIWTCKCDIQSWFYLKLNIKIYKIL